QGYRYTACPWVPVCTGTTGYIRVEQPLDGVGAALAGADAHRFLDRQNEDLAVADLVGFRRELDRLDRALGERVVEDHLDLHLREEVDHVFGAAIDLGVALRPAEAPDFADGHARDADLVQRRLRLAAGEEDAVLPGRGQGERHRVAAGAVAEQIGRPLGGAAAGGDELPAPRQVPVVVDLIIGEDRPADRRGIGAKPEHLILVDMG